MPALFSMFRKVFIRQIEQSSLRAFERINNKMSNLKLKSLRLTKTKVANVEGERRVVFVASTNSEDRDYERVMIETFRLPKKGGGEILVSDIPEGGTDEADIPLLTDHDLFAVDKVIGSVRRAFFTNGELIFEAGISSREYAQDVFKLIEEGHLDNAFSISFRDFNYNPDNGEIRNGEIIEVSLVSRGSNKDARVLEVKGLKEGDEVEEPTTPPVEEEKKEDVVEVKSEATEPVESDATEEKTEESEAEAPAEAKEEAVENDEEAKEETEAENVEENNESEEKSEGKENEMDAKSIAKTQVEAPAQAVKEVSNDYLKSKSAMADFAKIIANNRGNREAVKSAWKANLEAKGITGTYELPTELEATFFHTWNDVTNDVLNTFRRSNRRAGVAYAISGEGEGIRAKGHRKGDEKADQELAIIQRDLKGIIAYKKLPIDYIDLLEDEDGEILRFRTVELSDRLRTEVYTAAVLGDGRTAPASGNPDYRMFNGSRGLWSMVADIAGSATAGSFASKVASIVANVATDGTYEKIVKTLAAVKPVGTTTGNDRKVLVIDPADLTALALTKNEQGQFIFAPGVNFEEVFRCKIVELEGVKNSGYDVIAYANQGYTLLGTDDMVRTDFDIDYNRDVMLVERLVAGSLEGNKVAAGYAAE